MVPAAPLHVFEGLVAGQPATVMVNVSMLAASLC